MKEAKLERMPIQKRTFIIFSVLFLGMIAIIYSGFATTGTSFIWNNDGIKQHYLLFYDYMEKLRGGLAGEGFPLWDWSIGMGADVIYSYGYYVIGDPFVYLGLFFPSSFTELAYHVIVLIRLFAIGLSFLFYARKMNFSHHAGMLAAVMYTFTHFSIMNVIRHPFFLLPMIWYPLLCLGVEKIFRKESGLLFSVMVTVSAISNFYFFYKLTVLVFFYAVVRYIQLHREGVLSHFWRVFWRGVSSYLIGVMMAGALFVPMVSSFLRSSRDAGESVLHPLLYPLDYYPTIIKNLFTPSSYLWNVGGFSIFVVFALPFIWKRKGKVAFVPILLTVLGVGTLFPFFGSFMNGFSGPYNRYTFVLPFFLSVASAWFFDKREKTTTKQLKISRYLLLFFSLYLLGYVGVGQLQPIIAFFPILFGWLMWFVLKRERQSNHLKSGWLILLVVLNMASNNMVYYYPPGSNVIASRIPYGTAEETYSQLFENMEKQLPEIGTDPYRVGVTSEDAHVQNQFIYLDLMGLNSYLSLTNSSLSDFSEDLETSQYMLIQPLRRGFDDRRLANHQLGVRYILTHEENIPYLPVSYEIIHRTEGDNPMVIAETESAFPLAYAVDTWMPYQAFEVLNPVEKEALLVMGSTTENTLLPERVDLFNGELPVETLPFQIRSSQRKEYVNPLKIEVSEEESFEFVMENPEALKGKDVFVYFEGIEYVPQTSSFWKLPKVNYTATVQMNHLQKEVYQSRPLSFSSYFKRNNILFNMGHLSDEQTLESLSVHFNLPGTYHFDNIEVYALEADEEKDRALAEQRRENQLNFTTFTNDHLEGVITQDSLGLLVTSIPYTDGWTVEVNGGEVDTFVANSGFIGVPLPEGEAIVTMSYRTPFLDLGIGVSLAGLVLLFVNELGRRRKRVRKKNKDHT